jgi:hypothetical protein
VWGGQTAESFSAMSRLALACALVLAPAAAALVLPALPHRRAVVVRAQPSRPVARRCEPWLCAEAAAAAPSPDDLPEAEAGAWLWGPKPLEAVLPQVVLCLAGYLVHVCILSRRSFSLAGRALGWDTLVGLGVIGVAAWRRKRLLGRAVPPWLDGSGSGSGTADEASNVLDLSDAPDAEKVGQARWSRVASYGGGGATARQPWRFRGGSGLRLGRAGHHVAC